MSKRKTNEEFLKELYEAHNDCFEQLTEYVNSKTKMKFRHRKCGYEFYTRGDVINASTGDNGCPNCSHIHLEPEKLCLWEIKPEIAKLLTNPKDGYVLTKQSKKSASWTCPDCGHEQIRKVHTIVSSGFICEVCNDGFSYPEKFMRSVLMQLGIDFEMQKRFNWIKGKKYDFYFDGILCETHGLQHYEHGFQCKAARTLNEEKENDKYKRDKAFENGFTDDTYITIDCRKSEKEWIKNSIINSKLAELYDLSKVNWDKCELNCLTSMMMQVCDLWNKGLTTTDIKRELHLSNTTSVVSKYLNICNFLGMCKYDPKESQRNGSRNKVVCLNTREIFGCIKDAETQYNIKNISGCCIGQIKSAGRHPKTNEQLVWRHYEDYIKMTDDEIQEALQVRSNKAKKIICMNDLHLFDAIIDAAKWCGLKNASSITAVLMGRQKTSGRHPLTNEPLSWKYYDDYLEELESTAS